MTEETVKPKTVRKPRAKKTVDISDPYLYPECPKELLEQMRDIYAKYSGYEVAQAIRSIRTEIEIAQGQRNAETLLPLDTVKTQV